MTEHTFCVTPEHVALNGGYPLLMRGEWHCVESTHACIRAALVPVAQREAEQAVIDAAATYAKATRERVQFYRRDVRAGEMSASKLDKAEGLQRREADALDNLLAANDILMVRTRQAIPVDTEVGNGE